MFVGQRVGPFEIEKEIGSGAMGTVYRARFEKDGERIPVALKVIALGLIGNEGAMARFDRESGGLPVSAEPEEQRCAPFQRAKHVEARDAAA